MKTLEDALKAGRELLKEKNIADGDLDAWYLLSYSFQISRAEYLLHPITTISTEQYNHYIELIRKRSNHYPLQYIIGEQEFMGLTFHVSEEVLIPRQDTEILVEEVLKVAKGKEVLDMCTGSGCIIISLAKLGDIKRAVAVDISEGALAIAKRNAADLRANVEFIQSDLYSHVDEKFDIIVSNPPYIPSNEISVLMNEVKNHEPRIALDGKSDGLYFYQSIIKGLSRYLKQGGYVFFEIGYNQGREVCELLAEKGITDIKIRKDLAGLDRIVSGRYMKATGPFT